jgi:ligand-binding SRPBCC domain-containing protein
VPVFTAETILACPREKVWELLIRPTTLVQVSPPELNLRLIEAPELLHLGARIVIQGRRWGLSQRMVSVVTAFEPGLLLIDEQREGPFRSWVHTHRLEAISEGTRMTDQVDFEPPGGLLGFLVTARRVEQELAEMFRYRGRRFKDLLEGS